MTITDLVMLIRRYLVSIAVCMLVALALAAGGSVIASGGATYTAEATAHMEVTTAEDYNPDNQFNHVTRSQLAYQKMRNYEALYTAEETLEKVIAENRLDIETSELREAITLTTDADRLLETVEVSLPDRKMAVAVANGIINTAAAEIQEIEGEGTFVVSNIAPATEDTTTANALSSKKLLALGLMLGLVAGFAQALYRFLTDDRVRSVADVQRFGDLPVLAVVPASGDRSEAMRHVRSSLLVAGVPGRPVAVTALSDGADSSRVAKELAGLFAASGHDTVLVDANSAALLSTQHAATGKRGVSNMAGATSASLDSLLLTDDAGYGFVPAGTAQDSVADSLASSAVRQALVEAAAARVVIVDCGRANAPFSGLVSLLVAHYGSTRTNDIAMANRQAVFSGSCETAVILDDADFSKRSVFRFGNPTRALALPEPEPTIAQ